MIELILLGIGCTMIGLGLGFLVALWYIRKRTAQITDQINDLMFIDARKVARMTHINPDGSVTFKEVEDDRNNGN